MMFQKSNNSKPVFPYTCATTLRLSHSDILFGINSH